MFGTQNTIGTSSDTIQRSHIIGYLNKVYDDECIAIGRNLQIPSSNFTSLGNRAMVLGHNNDYGQNDYDHSTMSITLIVGAGFGGGNSQRKDAFIITQAESSSVYSQIIMPQIGQHNNFPNDSTALLNGVPLYGLYHNNGDLRIRVAGAPASTTTSTTSSSPGPGSSGARWKVTRCGGTIVNYISQYVYCDGGNLSLMATSFSSGDTVQFQISTNCSGATYCGVLSSVNDGPYDSLATHDGSVTYSCNGTTCTE